MTEVNFDRQLTTVALGESVTFTEALTEFAREHTVTETVGFAYTPSEAPWFCYDTAGWRTRDGSIPPTAFEVRAFNSGAELRWWRTTGFDRGTAVVLTESTGGDATETALFRLDGQRSLSLWGSAAAPSSGGWVSLAEPRLRDPLWVPVADVKQGAEMRLRLVEYATRDQHGNISVAEQRLVGLAVTEDN